MKAGVKNSGWNIGKILKAIFFLLHDTHARQDVYENVTGTNQYPLQYCGHRWCENEDVRERADVIWPYIVKFVRYLMSLPESQQPKRKTFKILPEAVKYPLMQAKLKLVEFMLVS